MIPFAAVFLAAVLGTDLVDIRAINPAIRLDIRYATANNFTKQPVYPEAACYLRSEVAVKLSAVQRDLEGGGLGLKVFDCYRPLSVQKQFWRLVPDERYVANPAKGSRHNRGAAVDLTLVDREGRELEMPTGYDDFSERAHRDFTRLPAAAIRHRAILERAMRRHGFVPLPTEWWHFDAQGWESFSILDIGFSELRSSGSR